MYECEVARFGREQARKSDGENIYPTEEEEDMFRDSYPLQIDNPAAWELYHTAYKEEKDKP